MRKYYVLLRGVNVSGKNKILMKELAESLSKTGFSNVKTYIQSGNIVLETELPNKEDVEISVKKCILEKFECDVLLKALTSDELYDVVNNNPFDLSDVKKLYYAFLFDIPTDENKLSLSEFDIGEDKYVIDNNIMYVFYNSSAGKSKLNNSLIERKLKISSTMRNHNTVSKLLDKY